MFREYGMVAREKFSEYFGFLDSKVDRLSDICQKTTKNAKLTRGTRFAWYCMAC